MALENRKYPHLLQEDIDLWKEFLALYESQYIKFDYDVRVGTGRDPGADFDPAIRSMGIGLSQRRIDVVGWKETYIDIIEITLHAGMKAIGQLHTYPLLYRATYPVNLPLRRVLVTRNISPDIRGSLDILQISAYVFP